MIDPGKYRKDSPFAEQHPLVTPATTALTAWSATIQIDELVVTRRGGPAVAPTNYSDAIAMAVNNHPDRYGDNAVLRTPFRQSGYFFLGAWAGSTKCTAVGPVPLTWMTVSPSGVEMKWGSPAGSV